MIALLRTMPSYNLGLDRDGCSQVGTNRFQIPRMSFRIQKKLLAALLDRYPQMNELSGIHERAA